MSDATLYTTSNPTALSTIGDKPLITPIRAVLTATFWRPNNTTTYAANDIVSDSASQLIFNNAAIQNGGSGIIRQASLIDNAYVAALLGAFELALFTAAVAIQTDNGLAAFTDAEMLTWVGNISFGNSFITNTGTGAAGSVGFLAKNVDLEYVCASADTRLFGLLMARNAYVPVGQERFDLSLFVQRFS